MLSGTLAHYRIKGRLGRGGMGEVYRVEDTRLGRDVALKTLIPELARDEERLKRFRREAQLLAALDHPGIVTIFSIEEAAGLHFLTMQLVEGETLARLIPEEGMDIERFLDVALPLTDAVAAAHERGIVHRDLKPSNVMRSDTGRVRVLDFGLAKLAAPEGQTAPYAQDLTRDGDVVGTVPYMSPEQLTADAVDERTDIFSLGVILYEMATGRRPFEGSSPISLISSILSKNPIDIERVREHFPPEATALIGRCLRKKPADRIETARELHRRLLKISETSMSGSGASTTAQRGVWRGASIAVLPFTTLSTDPEDEFFADGIAEEIISALGRVPGLKVAARTSAFSFKGRHEDLRSIGEKLGVDTLLEGTVRRAGDRLRITAQLVDADAGYQQWSERYDRRMTDVFEIQEEIARKIASRLTETLISDSDPSLLQKGTSDIEAFKLYTQGRGLFEQRNEISLRRAVQYFRGALDHDPHYALAWTGLADTLVVIEEYGLAESGTLLPDARIAIDRALDLDRNLAEAHASYGLLQTHQDVRQGRIAIEALERAVRINPNYAAAYHWQSWMRIIVGHAEKGLDCARRAVDLNPLSPEALANLSLGLLATGRLDESVREARRAAEIQPDYGSATLYECVALYRLGRFDEAIARSENLTVEWAPTGPDTVAALAEIRRGNRNRGRELMERISRAPQDQVMSSFIHVALGEEEEALRLLSHTTSWGYWPSISILSVLTDQLSSLRHDPRYGSMIQSISEWWGMTTPDEEPTQILP